MDDELTLLTADELLVMAALLRCMIRLDGRFSEAEREALARVATMVAAPIEAAPEDEGPYRTGDGTSVEPLGEVRLWELMDLAAKELPDDDSIREAALAIERKEAREAIYGVLFEVASADVAGWNEPKLLDWLTGAWNLPVEAIQ